LAQRAYDRAKAAVPPEQRGNVRMSVSCALFVPKSQTPFQWDGQIVPEEAMRRVNLLRSSVKYRAVDVHWHDPSTSFIEAVMSRGGRECAAWVERAWERGARFDAWSECFNREAWSQASEELGLDPESIAHQTYDLQRTMPWSHISTGVSEAFLRLE
ncbi:MAG: B12-binding domain-containing radical SAM protein, partial [Raoultibacter sp.]